MAVQELLHSVVTISDPSILGLGATAMLLAQAGLISGLLVQRRRRRQIEERLRHREAELRVSYDRIRDVGSRLLTAQEAERTRIARELHDDISQQLAVLEIGLRQSWQQEENIRRLSDVAKSVHDLSHRLHPARLELLGLVESVGSLVLEQSRTGIPVMFTHAGVPQALSPALTLCLYRTVQETLQNAMKYSQATQVTVDLRCDQSALTLTIDDDGIGFDPEVAWRNGLGLISIRERVEGSGGVVAVHSRPGLGARVEVRIPLNADSNRPIAIGGGDGCSLDATRREWSPSQTVVNPGFVLHAS